MDENEIGTAVVDCAIRLHRETGPGLLESVYEKLLAFELESQGLKVESQAPIKLVYKGISFDEGFRADLVVESQVILELKSVSAVKDIYKKQLLTYLKLTGMKLGYVLNFGEGRMVDGIVRIVNGL